MRILDLLDIVLVFIIVDSTVLKFFTSWAVVTNKAIGPL